MMIKYLRRFQFSLLYLFVSIGIAKSQGVVGVSIAEDTLPPNKTAILDVRSINKGVRLPTVSYNQLMGLKDKLILNNDKLTLPNNKYQGLTFYVDEIEPENIKQGTSSQDLRGFYYWDPNLNNKVGDWARLEPINTVYPIGSIIMYSGPMNIFDGTTGVGTGKYAGWKVCNGTTTGNIVVPDLSGRFIVGFDPKNEEYNKVGNTGGNDFVKSDEYFPCHQHTVNNTAITAASIAVKEVDKSGADILSHTHQMTYPTQHKHGYETTKREASGQGALQAHRNQKWTTSTRRWGIRISKETFEKEKTLAITSVDIDKTPPSPSSITVSLGEDTFAENENKSPKPLDLRPSYYVVAYIIRIK